MAQSCIFHEQLRATVQWKFMVECNLNTNSSGGNLLIKFFKCVIFEVKSKKWVLIECLMELLNL